MKWLAFNLLLKFCLSSATALLQCQDEDQGKGNVYLQKEFTRRDTPSYGSIKIRDGAEAVQIIAKNESLQPRVPDDFNFSYLHEVVGRDGVKVITLERTPKRFAQTAERLAKAGILATSFKATDITTARQEDLRYGCIGGSSPDKGKCAPNGCMYRGEQAIAASHRRALEEALQRNNSWTAIVEDDMVPVQPERWNVAFKAAWTKLQEVAPEARFVRLSWCNIVKSSDDHTMDFVDAGDFTLTKSLDGLCTGAYMIHKDVIPEILSLFPCCVAVDTCWSVHFHRQDQDGKARGLKYVMSMQLKHSRQIITELAGEEWLGQHGIMYQDRHGLGSTKGFDKALFTQSSE